MSLKIVYLGWARFGNSGGPYRKWRFDAAVPALKAIEGDELFDLGPGYEKPFEVRRNKTVVCEHDQAAIEKALGMVVDRWRPPREENEILAKAMGEISAALQALVVATEKKNAPAESATPPKRPAVEAKANAFLRLIRSDTYANTGDAFRHWELLVDVPTIPATRTVEVKGPRHAVAGDILVEEDDNLTPFELKRGGVRIGDPEWWQVRHLFVGLREGAEGGEGAAEGGDCLLSQYFALVGGEDTVTKGAVFYASRALPGTAVREGDYVVGLYEPVSGPQALRATVQRVPRAQLATVEAGIGDDSLRPLYEVRPGCWTRGDMVTKIRGRLRKTQRPTWSDANSPLIIVRPLVAPVSEPIMAASDAGALFELLHQVGGRMPKRRRGRG